MNFNGKKVLITGSTQGIGYETAKEFVKLGAEVIIHCSKDIQKAERIKNELGAKYAVVADLSSLEETKELYKKTGDVDILVLNASVQFKENWLDISDEHFEKTVNTNVRSTLTLMQSYYPKMKEQCYGRIITVGSVNQYRQHPELSLYAMTKCAVMSLVKNVAKFSAPYGITVNNIAPGAIDTPRNSAVKENPELLAKVNQQIPMGRFGDASEVANLITFLASDDAKYITGEDFVIDGGMKL